MNVLLKLTIKELYLLNGPSNKNFVVIGLITEIVLYSL